MALIPLLAMVRKDLQLFFSDRRSVIISFVVPIAIASFFGSIFSGPATAANRRGSRSRSSTRTAAPISKSIVAGAQADKNFKLTMPHRGRGARGGAARQDQRRGHHPQAASAMRPGKAFFGDGEKPALDVLFDPSRSVEVAMVRGILTQHVMEAVSKEMFGGEQGRKLVDQTLPQIAASRCRTIRSAR